MSAARDDGTQLVCDPGAFSVCPCTDEAYSCDCDADEAGVECTACGAALIRINMDTGERAVSP